MDALKPLSAIYIGRTCLTSQVIGQASLVAVGGERSPCLTPLGSVSPYEKTAMHPHDSILKYSGRSWIFYIVVTCNLSQIRY